VSGCIYSGTKADIDNTVFLVDDN